MYFYAINDMWNAYKQEKPDTHNHYEAWAFGDSKQMADELAELVLKGIKTVTASNYLLYEEDEPIPYPGLHNILLDGDGKPVTIIVTTLAELVPFDEVTAEHAFLEGEGDRTLRYWQDVHQDFFKREFAETNQTFHHKIPVLCERFKIVYKN